MAPGQELPSPLLRRLSPPVSFPGLLSGPRSGLPRGHQRRLGLYVVKIALTARKGDGALQLAPLCSQAQALGLKVPVFIGKILSKQAYRVSRPSKESLAKSAMLPGALEHVFHTIICPKQAPGATNQHSPSGQGAGGWHPRDGRARRVRSLAWSHPVPR